MEEEREVQESVSLQTETQTSVESKQTLDSFPSIENLRKSEQEVKVNTQIEGVTQVEQQTRPQDRVFKRKADERKVFFKKRLKIVTVVYTAVVALLLGFAITNTVTLAQLDNSVNTKTDTIEKSVDDLGDLEGATGGEKLDEFTISLNEPRDYSEDKKELTWLDKLTIVFRNLFA